MLNDKKTTGNNKHHKFQQPVKIYRFTTHKPAQIAEIKLRILQKSNYLVPVTWRKFTKNPKIIPDVFWVFFEKIKKFLNLSLIPILVHLPITQFNPKRSYRTQNNIHIIL
jgi:hypothetical protein